MSQWTHVSGLIRVDGIPGLTRTGILMSLLYDVVPDGSEGPIHFEVITAGDGLVWKTVAVWGDLRDFDAADTKQIDEWFERICQSELMLRAAHLLVEVEYKMSYILLFQQDESGRSVKRIENL